MDYPAYREINNRFEVAELVSDLSPESLAQRINTLLQDKEKLERLRKNCLAARQVYNWQQEEKALLHFYQQVLCF